MNNVIYESLYHLNTVFLAKYKEFDESSQFLSPEMFKKISKSYLNDYSHNLKLLDFNSKYELKLALKEKKNLRKKILLDYKIRKREQVKERTNTLLEIKKERRLKKLKASRKNKKNFLRKFKEIKSRLKSLFNRKNKNN